MDGIDVEDRLWDPTNRSKFADDAAHHAISEAYMAVFADSAAAEGTTLDELYWPYTASTTSASRRSSGSAATSRSSASAARTRAEI